MTLQLDHKLFTRNAYHRMAEVGVLAEDEKVELINGNILTMSPVGSLHSATVNRFIRIFKKKLSDNYILSIQNPLAINNLSEPEPDVTILYYRKDFYQNEIPSSKDVPLLIEVADTSLEKDWNIKLPLYATANIPESWIVDLNSVKISVFTDPSPKGYLTTRHFFPTDVIEVSSIPNLNIEVSAVFGL